MYCAASLTLQVMFFRRLSRPAKLGKTAIRTKLLAFGVSLCKVCKTLLRIECNEETVHSSNMHVFISSANQSQQLKL
jgi:hypothetical protein